MKHNAAVTRIAHDLCVLLDDDWVEGRKLYLAKAQIIYNREIWPIRRFLVLITNEVSCVLNEPLNRVRFTRLTGLVSNAVCRLAELKTTKGPAS